LEGIVRYHSIFIENEIKNAIRANFPLMQYTIYHDESRDEYVVAIYDKDVYYSDEYRKLVMELKINSLWPADINNYFFVVEDMPQCTMKAATISFTDGGSVAWNMWHSCSPTELPQRPSLNTSKLGLAA
jgi:hypothetical protein